MKQIVLIVSLFTLGLFSCIFLIACQGSMQDAQTYTSGNCTDCPDGLESTPVPTPTPDPTLSEGGVNGTCYPIGGRICDREGNPFGNEVVLPTVNVLVPVANQPVAGGKPFQIKYIAKANSSVLPVVFGTVEYKRNSETEWHLIQEKVISVSGQVVSVNWDVPPDTITESAPTYKIRVTVHRLKTQTGTVDSSDFTIDSEKPNLSSTGFSKLSDALGVVKFELKNATDPSNRSVLVRVCLKEAFEEPLLTDICWKPVSLFGSGSTWTIPVFFGLKEITSKIYYAWVQDKAGNVSTLGAKDPSDTGLFSTLNPTSDESGDDGSTPTTGDTTTGTPALGIDGQDRVSFAKAAVALTTTSALVTAPTPVPLTWADPTANSDLSRFASETYLSSPGSLLIGSNSVAYILDTTGVRKFDLLTGTSSTFINQANMQRIAFDADENIIALSAPSNNLVKIEKYPAAAPTPTPLVSSIPYHANMKYYGTFEVLPNNWVVYTSGNPIVAMKNTVLNVFKPEEYLAGVSTGITSISFSGADSAVAESYSTYGPIGISYDHKLAKISALVGRFCAMSSNVCTSDTISKYFDGNGILAGEFPILGMGLFGNEYLKISPQGSIYVLNGWQGRLGKTLGVGAFVDVFAVSGRANPATYCDNGTLAINCKVRVDDFYLDSNGRVFFLEGKKIRWIDEDGLVQTLFHLE